MAENSLIPLPGYQLPFDLPWRTSFVTLVNSQLKRLRTTGHFLPPRFFGYYLQEEKLVGVAGAWTVRLDSADARFFRLEALRQVTSGKYSIEAHALDSPEYILVHDRRDGACWLWTFHYGHSFIETTQPVRGDNGDEQESNLPRPPRP